VTKPVLLEQLGQRRVADSGADYRQVGSGYAEPPVPGAGDRLHSLLNAEGLTSPLRPGTTSPAEVQHVASRSGTFTISRSLVAQEGKCGWRPGEGGTLARQPQPTDRLQTDQPEA